MGINTSDPYETIRILREENAYLKSLLKQNGIDISVYNPRSKYPLCPTNTEQQSVRPLDISYENIRRFYSFFWGRTDVFSKRSQNKTTGKSGYYVQCNNFWKTGVCPKADGQKMICSLCPNRSWMELRPEHIIQHIAGEKSDCSDVIGIYPLFPDGTCRLLVFDFDNHGGDNKFESTSGNSWMEEVDSLREICELNTIPCLVERSRSGNGAHLWIFFSEPVPASTARQFGFVLLDRGSEHVNLKSFKYYDRMIPAQDNLPKGGLGNLIALPLQGQALKMGNSAFVDKRWNAYTDQWASLTSTKRMSKDDLERFISSSVSLHTLTNSTSEEKPWERSTDFRKEDVSGQVKITLANKIYIDTSNLKPRIQNQIRRLAAFSNPVFFRNKAIGLSNYDSSRFIYLGEDTDGYICLPRGLYETLIDKLLSSGIEYKQDDKRSVGDSIDVSLNGELRKAQAEAVNSMCSYNCGILNAATAFGKTVVSCGIIAQKKTSTLIILESSALIDQWQKEITRFLEINETPPEYKTPSGRTKKRSNCIGTIQGAKDTSTGIIDIAMAGSLCKKGEYHYRLKKYGLIIVDECHHTASATLQGILQETNAKYVYGVTATPRRSDGLEKINYMLLGPIRYSYSAKERALEQGIDHVVIPRFTRTVAPHGKDKLTINEAYDLIRNNQTRDDQICEDARKCIDLGRTPLILTKYVDHAKKLYEQLKDSATNCFLLTGNTPKKQIESAKTAISSVSDKESVLLIATGQLIGEGFDYPRLDTLIMASPIAWKGLVTQYAGRLNRDYVNKKDVIIYDYIDSHIPVFSRMYQKRLKAYKQIGYQLYVNETGEVAQTNSYIFSYSEYAESFIQDIKSSRRDVVICSPSLSKKTVDLYLPVFASLVEKGIIVSIVTCHPDVYKYGSFQSRIDLLEALRDIGCHIELVKEYCDRFAVIDRKIVWYGSASLLSKPDVEDSMMRIVSGGAAAELLESVFSEEATTNEYEIPL